MQQHGGTLLMLHTCSINLCQRGRVSDLKKNILSENIRIFFFAIDYQENTTICLLQPKIVGRNYLSMNNRYIIFIRFININNTAHHLCTNLYLRYTIQNKLSNIYFEQ